MTTKTTISLFLRGLGCLLLLSVWAWNPAMARGPFGGGSPTEHSSLEGGPVGADKGAEVCCLSPWECTDSCFSQKDKCDKGCENRTDEGLCLVNCHLTFEECNKRVDEMLRKCYSSHLRWGGVLISDGPACSASSPGRDRSDFAF